MTLKSTMSHPKWPRVLAFGLAYLAAIIASRLVSTQTTTYVIFWLPAGVYVAGLLLIDSADWLVPILVVNAVNLGFDLLQGTPPVLALLLSLANTAEATAGAHLFRRWVARQTRLDTLREFLGLTACSAILGVALGAAMGAAALVQAGYSASFPRAWVTWFIGNSMAILIVAPFVLAWGSTRRSKGGWWRRSRRLLEAALVTSALIGASWTLLVRTDGIMSPYKFLLIPLVVWPALRFGLRGASTTNLLFALLVSFLTSHYARGLSATAISSGSFVSIVQLFLATCALVGLIPAIAIAERNRTLLQLSQSEARYRNLGEAAYEGVVISEGGRILDANDQALALFGYERAEFIGLEIVSMVSPDSRHLVASSIAADREVSYEHRLLRKDGTAFEAEARAKVMHFDGRKIRMTAVRDITARKRADAALLASLREVTELRTALDEHAIVSITDPQGRIIFANDKFCALSKYSRGELLGQDYRIVNSGYHPKEFIRDLWSTIAQGRVWRGQIRNRAKDGSFYWVDTTIVPILDDRGKPRQYVAIRADITLLKELQQQLIERNTELKVESARSERANRMKSEFLANLSHELRTPLNGIIGFSSFLMSEKPGPVNAKQKEFLGDVLNSGQHLLRLINDLLDLAKIEAGKLSLSPEPFSLRSAVDEVLGVLHPLIEKKQLGLSVDVVIGDDEVTLDSRKFKQVLYNLLSNAIKFTPNGGRIGLEGRNCGEGRFELRISDTGVGIRAEDMGRLFVEFSRLASPGDDFQEGAGLGLVLTRRFVELHQGRISVSSEPGRGSTFTVNLPTRFQ